MSMWDRVESGLQKAVTRLKTQASVSTLSSGTPNRYGDMKNNTWNTPVSFYCTASSTPLEGQLEDSGWHTGLEFITVRTPVTELQRVGLVNTSGEPLFKMGDRLIFNGIVYEIRIIDNHGTALGGQAVTIAISAKRGVE